MEFLDFLKYGAIGVSLALAILSYRLLSKEQDKAEVRTPILTTIKLYFLFSLFLSMFFGSIELITKGKRQPDPKLGAAIDKIWEAQFAKFPDSTFEQKLNRINRNKIQPGVDTAQVCMNIMREYQACREALEKFDRGFYQNIIRLQNEIGKDPDGWINIGYRTNTKPEVISSLRGILSSLGDSQDEISDQEVIDKWKSLKQKWAKDKLGYIFKSDITMVVKEFIGTFDSGE
jgi:hypothetical protein